MICILDSRASSNRADYLASRLGFASSFCVPTIRQCGGILLFWNPSCINISILNYHESYLRTKVGLLLLFMPTHKKKNKNSYGLNIIKLKLDPSYSLGSYGGFNNIYSLNEKIGGTQTVSCAMLEFNSFINDYEVLSLDAKGIPFTWCNDHKDTSIIYERLDRALVNPNWSRLYPHYDLQNLPIITSNHGPIYLAPQYLKQHVGPLNLKPCGYLTKISLGLLTKPGMRTILVMLLKKTSTCCATFQHFLKYWKREVFDNLFHILSLHNRNCKPYNNNWLSSQLIHISLL